MKTSLFLATSITLALLSPTAFAQQTTSPEAILFGFDFAPGVGTSSAHRDAPRYVSLNLIGGLSGGTRLLEIGGVININNGPVTGLQIAGATNTNKTTAQGLLLTGATNIVGGTSQGALIAGAANIVGGASHGALIAGAANITADEAQGLRIAGATNINGGDVLGLQAAGATNIVGGASQGALIAGAANITANEAQGLRIAGATNIHGSTLQGAQIAGALNYTRSSVQGLQIAPINIAGADVKGLQIGVINIARSSTASIGLIGIYLAGFLQPETYLSEDGILLAGIRHGSGNFYNIYGLGTRLYGGPTERGPAIAASLGFGWRLDLSPRLELSFDLTTTSVITETKEWNWKSYFNIFKFRPLVSVELLDFVAIFGGPTLALSLPTDSSTVSAEDFALIEGWHLGKDMRMWPGFTLGLRFL